MDTTQMYYYFLHKTPKMEINRKLLAEIFYSNYQMSHRRVT